MTSLYPFGFLSNFSVFSVAFIIHLILVFLDHFFLIEIEAMLNITQVRLKFEILLSRPHREVELQACTTMTG